MNSYEAEEQIVNCENQIRSNNNKIEKIKKRIAEIKQIQNNFKSSGKKFDDYINSEKRYYEQARNTLCKTHFAVQYSEEMLNFANSTRTRAASDKFYEAVHEIQRKITIKQSEKEELESENSKLRYRIKCLNRTKIMLEEQERNGVK